MQVGRIEITPLIDGTAVLDPVEGYPDTTAEDWQPHRRWLTHDGRLQLDIGCFLIRTGGRTVLVDAGLGPYEVGPFSGGRLIDELRRAGASPEDVTDVVLTHLHFDHVGWVSQKGVVVFPKATYRCHAADWAHFQRDDRAARKLATIAERLETWDGGVSLAPGLDTMPTPGHTPGHTALVVSDGDERVMLLGDATHCPVELEEAEWAGLGDVDPVLARRTREAVAVELEGTGTLATAAHFPGLAFGRLIRGRGRRNWVVDGLRRGGVPDA